MSEFTDLTTLKIGTTFHVLNGNWWGTISQNKAGEKIVIVHDVPLNVGEHIWSEVDWEDKEHVLTADNSCLLILDEIRCRGED